MIKNVFDQEVIKTQWEVYQQKARALWENHQREIKRTAAGMMIACIVSVGGAAAVQPNAYEISYNDEILGYVKDEASLDEALQKVESSIAEQTGLATVALDAEGLNITRTRVKTKPIEFATAEELTDILLDKQVYRCDAYSIVVDGVPVLAAASEEDANAILERVKQSYSNENSKIISAEYKEKVEVVASDVRDLPVAKDVESGVSYILTGTEDPRTYVVQSGDTLWDIAHANGMTSAELIAANPGFDPNRLKIGQELNLVAMKPFMTMVITEEVTETESIPFTTQYTDNSSMYKGQTSIITAGQNGSKEVVSKVVSENGVEVSREKLSENVVSQPVVQTAYRGTKALTYTTASGKRASLSNPLASIVMSDGYGASRGSRRHAGVDLRSSKGAPIYAAADGLVTKVSSNGSYGKLVVIDHGNGVTTKYAHCTSFNVSVGDTVTRGQQIATVGSTGNATGNILHYEVLINGSNVNPANYLN